MDKPHDEAMGAYGIDVRSGGRAAGDGSTDDAPAIQRALDARQGPVVIPPGTYRIGTPLRLHSGTRLAAHRAAHLRLADGAGRGRRDFLVCNADPEAGNADISITGGLWDGNNPANRRGPDAPSSYTGVLMDFRRVRGLRLMDLTLRDAESYYIRLGECRDFLVEGIRFQAQHLRPNQDGVHLGGGCQDGQIRDVAGIGTYCTSDDIVALNADDACGRAQNLDLICAPIRRIRVDNLSAGTCHTFVRLLSVHAPIEDVIVTNVRGGCRVAALNMDACRDCMVKLFDPADPHYQNGVGDIQRVSLRHLRVWKSAGASLGPLIDLRSRARALVIDDFQRPAEEDGQRDAPTLACSEHAAERIVIEGITPAQRRAIESATSAAKLAFQPQVHPGMQDYLRLTAQPDAGRLVLPGGGFDRLSIEP
jgi:hypothetical protein